MSTKRIIIGGIYRHYKGDLCKVLSLVQHSETLETMVHYLDLNNGTEWVRDEKMFLEKLEINGETVERFKFVKVKAFIKT